MRGKAKNYTVRLPDGTIAKPYCKPMTMADGTTKDYWYAWRGRGGTRLVGEKGTPQWLDSLIAAHRAITNPDDPKTVKTVKDLSRVFQMSIKFTGQWAPGKKGKDKPLSDRSKHDYRQLLAAIEDEIGGLPLIIFMVRGGTNERKVIGDIYRWRDEIAAKGTRRADYTMDVLRGLFSFGVRRGYLNFNPLEGYQKIHDGTRVNKTWSNEQERTFTGLEQYQQLHLPVLMGAWLGQRQGDILRAKWYDPNTGAGYDGGDEITILQHKTGRRVVIYIGDAGNPVKPALDAELARRKLLDGFAPESAICVNSDDQPWKLSSGHQFHGFCASMQKALQAAGISGVAFTDLRGTFITRAFRSGSLVEEIADITGHTPDEINAIIYKHYLKRDPEAGRRVMSRLVAVHGGAPLKLVINNKDKPPRDARPQAKPTFVGGQS